MRTFIDVLLDLFIATYLYKTFLKKDPKFYLRYILGFGLTYITVFKIWDKFVPVKSVYLQFAWTATFLVVLGIVLPQWIGIISKELKTAKKFIDFVLKKF